VPEIIGENGGEPIRSRVGHSFIKAVMAESGAVFGGEHSGHYYFRDNYRADSGLIAAVIVLEQLSGWRGLRRSWSLVRGLFWRIFGILLLVLIIRVIIGGIVGALLGLAGSALDTNGQLIVTDVAGTIANVFVSPIAYIAVTLLYYDTRIRKEGFDIEMLAQTL